MASSVGSDIFAVVALLVISLLVLLLLRYYLPLRSTPAYLLVPVFLALALPCSIILLVPIDLASTADPDDAVPNRGVWLPPNVVLVTWRITYWLTFVLTWLVLPLLGEYVDSGARDVRGRLMYSLGSNGRYMLIALLAGVAGLVYYIMNNEFRAESIKSLVMALAYSWGLILAIGLMGHGLVALPRRLFKNASVRGRLERLQAQAPKTKERLDEATDDLEEVESTVWQLKQRKHGASRDMQEWIDELADSTAVPDARPGTAAALGAADVRIPAVLTERYLADLTRKLKRAKHKKARFVNAWSTLVQQAQDAQTILDAASSKRLDFGRERGVLTRLKLLTPSVRYQVYMNIIPATRMALAVLLAAASVMIIFSEVVKSFAPRVSIVGLSVVHHPDSDGSKVGFAGQLIASAWLLFMITCALYAMSDVKVWGNRALVKRQTYAESACWYALQVAKFTVPLAYNFITMLPPAAYESTQFYRFLGKLIDFTPLGFGFSTFFPCFVLLPVLATAFNLYGRAKTVFRFSVLEDDSEENPTGFGTGGWREGRALIERELQSRESGNVGLPPRGTSLDLERRTGTTALSRGRPAQREPLLPSHNQDSNRRLNAVADPPQLDEGEDDGPRHFYEDLGQRLRNTWDTAERPEWMKNFALKTPKWMQTDAVEEGRGSSVMARWFGGRPDDGRVRL